MNIQQNLAIRLLRVLRYNKARIERAMALMPEQKRPLFNVLPFLLHINHPDFPGYVDDDRVPFGINNYSFRPVVAESLYTLFPANKTLLDDIKQIWPRQRQIDALVLMGSIGSIAQTEDSDFDYWVCFDGSQWVPEQISLLEEKLRQIEHWAEHEFGLEVHFFTSEIERVRHNDFGEASGESSGSAQALFLKAEFYTTNIVVAGKAPLWWLLPDKVSDEQYNELIGYLKEGQSPDPSWFMDLGNLQRLDPSEIFGAAIWQISKAMDSPFKSVLKLAKLEVFLENIEHGQPLCNLLKRRVHTGAHMEGNEQLVDPYGLMFDELMHHYDAIGDQESIDLLRLCLYIKCDCRLSEAGEENFKRDILRSYVKSWGWSRQRIEKIDQLRQWNFQELIQLSRQIHGFLISCYRRISGRIGQYTKQSVSEEDMTVIGRRIEAFYAKKPHKIECLRSAFEQELYCRTVAIEAETVAGKKRRWSLYDESPMASKTAVQGQILLKSGDDPIELMLWAVRNRIIDSKTEIQLGYKTEPVTEVDLYKLVRQFEKQFASVRIAQLPRQDLLSAPRITAFLVIANFESRRTKPEIDSLKLAYLTSWGEYFLMSGFEGLESIWARLQKSRPRPPMVMYVPEGTLRQRLEENFIMRSGLAADVVV
ncbi:class I adenylate cyclase [Aliiglaciecola sp. CAU 1673]|uniref:class I adenylate cyclase n=1 Tax=Aliiglaciecola sp. CAU 1673 TaxID=3032595 RepID=UPI0023DC43C0|nr:class I adenylate cyclase [Aliiglaciecola sp. CAU 1673]MDF2177220.1 class I adenylate cyclase [Aliiglaciecola sp. CAU 1673]